MAFRPTKGTGGTKATAGIKPVAAPGPGKFRRPRAPREPGTRPDVGPPRVTNYAKDPTDYGVQSFGRQFDMDGDGE